MTKKHFAEIAAAMAAVRPKAEDHTARTIWYRACGSLAAMCKRSNARFDVERFITACEA